MIERPTARTRTRFILYTSFEGPRSLHRSAPLGPPSTKAKSPALHASSEDRALFHCGRTKHCSPSITISHTGTIVNF
jgi:hypothetical protein